MEREAVLERSSRRRPLRKLIEGRMMRCPRCKQQHDILQYIPMKMIDEFVKDTTMIYKCPSCRWLFAPVDSAVFEALGRENGREGS